MPTKARTVNFEKALAELEKTIEQLERGELTLEESVKQFERGVNLIKSCQSALAQADKRVRVLIEKNNRLQLKELEDTEQIEKE